MNPAGQALLEPTIAERIRQQHQLLVEQGELPPRDDLRKIYANFNALHGPERLADLDGEALLNHLHDHSDRNSIVYWLEFKNDDEFPGYFGGIAGGSALNFGIYRRRETRRWMTGSPTQQRELELDEAIAIARLHRDQLLAAVQHIRALPTDFSEVDYPSLQAHLAGIMPNLVDKAWSHKYLSLLFPDRLVAYHVESYQRYYLIKMLQAPVEGKGRYLQGGLYAAIAREMDMPMVHLTTVLTSLDGRARTYWRAGSGATDAGDDWQAWLQGGYMAEGWPLLGSLANLRHDKPSKDAIRERMAKHYPAAPAAAGRYAIALFRFVTQMEEGDIVFCTLGGSKVRGIGRIAGDYYFEEGASTPHRRPVEWLSTESWRLPSVETERYYYPFRDTKNLLEIERRILHAGPVMPPAENGVGPSTPRRLTDPIPRRIQSILDRKGQVILYGPPGTGKTYWAYRAMQELADIHAGKGERRANAPALVRSCTFHPAYGYEDFIEGYRPVTRDGQLTFERRPGLFLQFCADAAADPDRHHFLLIDEINRGDIPRIFGELHTAGEG